MLISCYMHCAYTQVSATSMEGVLVTNELSGSAFVYGSLSFLDKLMCGISLYAIQTSNGEEQNLGILRICGRGGG